MPTHGEGAETPEEPAPSRPRRRKRLPPGRGRHPEGTYQKSWLPTLQDRIARDAPHDLVVMRLNRGLYIRVRTETDEDPPGSTLNVTKREIEVLSLVREGYSNKIIGTLLSISERTVKSHLTFIMAKLAARDRTHAVVLAFRYGLMEF